MNIRWLLSVALITVSGLAYAQTPGLIYKSAGTGASVLDPNGDGYTSSSKTGFTGNDQTQSEIAYKPLTVPGVEPTSDPGPGPNCMYNDIVDSGSEDPVLTYFDGTNLLFRFRLGGTAPNSKSYSILLDTDQKFGFSGANADPNALSGNPGFEIEIVLMTNFSVGIYSVDGTLTPVLKASYSYDNYCQKSIAYTTNCSDPDYFYDFYIPFSAITTYFPSVTTSTPLRMVALTSMNPAPAIGNNAQSDVGGIDDGAYGNNMDNIFSSVIDNFYPTSVTGINSGFPADRTPCPSITSSLSTASTSISGTSSQANGTTIKVYKNGSLLGTTTVSSGTWTYSLSGLVAGNVFTASATATGKSESLTNCSTITVAASCSSDITIVNANTNNKNIGGTGISGATIRIYKNGVEVTPNPASSAIVDGTGNFCWKSNGNTGACNGGTGDIADGVYRVTQTESGKCESPGVYVCIGIGTSTTAPVITTSSVLNTTTSISGTAVASAYVILYADGTQIGATTAGASSPFSWTISALTLTRGQVLTAKAVSGTNCLSSASNSVTVTSITAAPVISGSYCTGTTIASISGTTSESGGTVIELFSGSTSLGTTTSNSTGAWTKTGLSISSGSVITAKATATGKTVSVASNSVTVGSLSSNSGLAVTSPIIEGASSIGGTLSGSGTVKVYVDETYLGTASVSGSTWTLSGLSSTALYAGASITATITSGLNCESNYSGIVTVQCVTPSASLSVSTPSTAVCSGSSATITVASSESGIIYQLYNGASTSGSSILGTGGTITLTSAALTTATTLSVRASKIFPTGCYSTLSNSIAFTIVPVLASNTLTNPATIEFCTSGDPASITGSTPTGGTGTYLYQWQTSTNNTTFTDINNATAKDYDPASLMATTYFRRIVTSSACSSTSSSTVKITINPAISGNTLTAPATTNFCATSGDAAAISGGTLSGGNGTYTYQWQSSTNGSTYTNIASSGTSSSYDPPNITSASTNYFRRIVTSGGCTDTSSPVVITISNSGIGSNTISTPITTFCASADPDIITGSTPTGGTGTYTYQWTSSTNNNANNGHTNIPGATGKDYDPGTLTVTTHFKRIVSSGCTSTSTALTITIGATSLSGTTITAPATTSFCGAADPGAIVGGTPSGGTSPYTYQWQSSTNNSTWTSVATTKDYDPPMLSVPGSAPYTYYYRRITVSNGACSVISNTVSIIITPATLSTDALTAPAVTSYCGTGDPAAITGSTPTGGSGTYTYQWQTSSNNTTFTNIASATSASYDPGPITSTTYFRRVVSSNACTSTSSNTVAITISTSTLGNNILTSPATSSFCSSGNPLTITGSTPTGGGGAGTYTYQWESSTDDVSFTAIGASSTSIDYDPPTLAETTYFRRVVTSSGCNSISASKVISIVSPVGDNTVSAPATTSFCSSGDPDAMIGSMPTGGTGTYAYQWQSSTDNISFADINGANAIDYDPGSIAVTTHYRRITTSSSCSSTSNTITILITPAITDNTLSGPATTSFCASGDPASIIGSTPAGGTGAYGYQWQSSVDNISFFDISGATFGDLDPDAVSATAYFRRIVTSAPCSSNSSSVTITVTTNTITLNSITSTVSTSLTDSGTPDIDGNNAGAGVTYLWQNSADNITYSSTGITTEDYTPGAAITSTTYFRRIASVGSCSEFSNVVVYNVNHRPVISGFSKSGNEDLDITFSATDFTTVYSDADNNSLTQIRIESTPANGTLYNASMALAAGAVVSLADLDNLVFAPVSDFSGSTTFTWKGYDGFAYSASPATVTISISAVNDAPVAANNMVTTDEDVTYTFTAGNFNASYSDAEGNAFAGIKITGLETAGALKLNGVDVSLNDVVSLADLTGSKLTFIPATNANGSPYATFTFQVSDGSAYSTASYTLTVNVTAVNDAPVASNNTVTTDEDVTYTFTANNFNASYSDTESNAFAGIKITGLETAGALKLNGIDVVLNDVVSLADLTGSKLTFIPATNANGSPYATFTFQVSDGSAYSTASYTLTVNVTALNDAPVAASNTVTTDEDVTYTFTPTNFNASYSDTESNAFAGIKITGLETAGALKLNGIDVVLNDVVSLADLTGSKLTFIPAANANGGPYATFTFQVSDGSAYSTASYTLTENVTAVNDAPVASNNTVTTDEDVTYTFTANNFNASYSDTESNAFAGIKITGLETAGALKLNGVDVVLNDVVSLADLTGSKLTFIPAANANASPYATFTFQVSDGSTYSTASYTLTVNVTALNDAPVAANNTVTNDEDVTYTFTAGNFNASYSDAESNAFAGIKITGLETAGALKLNGVDVVLNDVVSMADLTASKLTFLPAANANGSPYATFTFQVSDGSAYSTASYTLTVNVTAVNDAPVAANNMVTTDEDVTYTFTAGNFNASYSDTESNAFAGIKITGLETAGALKLNGVDVSLNDVVSLADLTGSKLTFIPVANSNGSPYATFTFQVSDGSTYSTASYTLTVNVTAVNDAPVASNNAVTSDEDVTYTFTAGNFNASYSDAEGNAFAGIKITGLETAGALKLNGVDVVLNDVVSLADLTASELAFIPAADANGSPYATFTFQVSDGSAYSTASYTLTVNVTALNDAPVAANNTVTTDEDVTHTFTANNFNASYSDTESNAFAGIKITGLETAGALKLNGVDVSLNDIVSLADLTASKLTFIPAVNANGSPYATFTFQVFDGDTYSVESYTLAVNVTVVNDAPVVIDHTPASDEDEALTFNVITGATDDGTIDPSTVDLDPSTPGIQQTQTTAEGEWNVDDEGSVTFNPAPDYHGSATIQYTVNDNKGATSNAGTISITVNSINDQPKANNDLRATEENTAASVNIIMNDSDIDGLIDPLTIDIDLVTPGIQTTYSDAKGSWSVDETGVLTFVPATNFNGSASIEYTVKDNDGALSNTATVTVNISAEPSSVTSVIETATSILTANGTSITTVTVRLKDANGNPITVGGFNVVLATSAGTLSAVTDNGDGTYTAILTSPTQVTVASINGKVEGNNITDTATVNFVPGPASGATSTITSAQTTLIANGVSTSVVTIQLKDINGNNLTSGGDNVTLTTTLGTLSDVTDNGDGTYSAMLTSSSTAGIAEITGVVNTNAINDNATITLTPATSPVLTATISANATTAIADGESTVQIVVTVRNASGTLVPGATILFSTTAGTLSSVVDNNDGTYTVTLTSSIIVEVAEVSFTINGVPNEETLDISFVDAPSIPTLFIPQGFSPDGDGENDTFVIEGAESFTVTLRIYNRWGAMVYESRHYKNDWAGLASHGVVIGDKLPDGTYFYAIDLNNGQTPFVRAMTIKRK